MRKFRKWQNEELDFLTKNYGKLHGDEIASHLGRKPGDIRNKAFRIGLKSNLHKLPKSKDIQDRINKTGVINVDPIGSVNKKIRFLCPFCSSVFTTTPHRVATNHTKSCGCVSLGSRTGGKYISGNFINHIKRGAKSRHLEYKLSNEFLDTLLEKQEFKCALTKEPLKYGYVNVIDYTASLDRINSSIGYIESNVQWLHKDVNLAKQKLSQEDFIELCRKVTENAEEKH